MFISSTKMKKIWAIENENKVSHIWDTGDFLACSSILSCSVIKLIEKLQDHSFTKECLSHHTYPKIVKNKILLQYKPNTF